MRCPFLREEQVKSCEAAPWRKSLVRAAARAELERCSSPAHVGCAIAPQSHEAHPSPARCPFLRESLVQFCGLTPLPTYVPWSASPELRCGHDGHRYCEPFRDAAPAEALVARSAADRDTHVVCGVAMPGWLLYASDHLWLDPGDDGICHVGVDAFLVQVVGHVERLVFLAAKGTVRAAVVLTSRGVDLSLLLPRRLSLLAANTRLRSRPESLTADPYGRGWLFEARWPAEAERSSAAAPRSLLRQGAAAREWMEAEVRRASELVHARLGAGRVPADGGRFEPDLLAGLDRERALQMLLELFPIPDTWSTP